MTMWITLVLTLTVPWLFEQTKFKNNYAASKNTIDINYLSYYPLLLKKVLLVTDDRIDARWDLIIDVFKFCRSALSGFMWSVVLRSLTTPWRLSWTSIYWPASTTNGSCTDIPYYFPDQNSSQPILTPNSLS